MSIEIFAYFGGRCSEFLPRADAAPLVSNLAIGLRNQGDCEPMTFKTRYVTSHGMAVAAKTAFLDLQVETCQTGTFKQLQVNE